MVDMFAKKNEQQATSVHFSNPRPQNDGSRCIEYLVGGTRQLCLLSNSSCSKTSTKMRTYACHMLVVSQGWQRMSWFCFFVFTSTTLGKSQTTMVSPKPTLSQPPCLSSGAFLCLFDKYFQLMKLF